MRGKSKQICTHLNKLKVDKESKCKNRVWEGACFHNKEKKKRNIKWFY